jgi:hypothetical protein
MQITITYPESWAEIKYSDYLKFYKQIKPYEQTDQYETKSLEAAAVYFCKVPTELLYKLPNDTYNKLKNHITALFKTTNDIPLTNMFKVDQSDYGFIPELDNMSYGEYLDLVTYTEKNVIENIPIIMSILYRPVTHQLGKSYTVESYTGTNDDRIELFKHVLTMEVVWGAISFFTYLMAELLSATLAYSTQILKNKGDKETLAVLEDLQKNGLDITQLPYWQTMMSQK